MRDQFRQGDVFIEKCDVPIQEENFEKIPKDNNRTILAYGEVTGHAHAITSEHVNYVKEKNTSKLYLIVDNTAKLKHEEHNEIPLAPAIYEVVRQREYTPEEIRYVAD